MNDMTTMPDPLVFTDNAAADSRARSPVPPAAQAVTVSRNVPMSVMRRV